MRFAALTLFILAHGFALSAAAVQIGDTYEEVIASLGKPGGEMHAGSKIVMSYPAGNVTVKNGRVVSISEDFERRLNAPPRPTPPKPAPQPRKQPKPPVSPSWRQAEPERKMRIGPDIPGQPAQLTLRAPYANSPEEYAKAMPGMFRQPISRFPLSAEDRQEFFFGPGEREAIIHLPKSYFESKPTGLLLYISPGDMPALPEGYGEILGARNLTLITPINAGNSVPSARRIALALDCLATAREFLSIDDSRIYICGFSGGGGIAGKTIAQNPNEFDGLICVCKGAILKDAKFVQPRGAEYDLESCMPYLSDRLIGTLARRHVKALFISASGDFNFHSTKFAADQWAEHGINAEFLDTLVMGHEMPPPEWMAKALDIVEQASP